MGELATGLAIEILNNNKDRIEINTKKSLMKQLLQRVMILLSI